MTTLLLHMLTHSANTIQIVHEKHHLLLKTFFPKGESPLWDIPNGHGQCILSSDRIHAMGQIT